MPSILIGECKQEVSSFNPVPSTYEDFSITRGEAIVEAHRAGASEIGGALEVFTQRQDIRLLPTYSARARTSGGTLLRQGFDRIAREFEEALREAPPVHGCYFSLHGAMSAEGEDDPEGLLLERARAVLGERAPFVVSLDLHGILTDRMLRHCDAVVVYHTYPHIDFQSTGARAARLLLKILDGRARPVTATVDVPALVRGDELITETGSIRHVVRAARALEETDSALSAGMFWGNPFTDVPELRSHSLVVTNGDPQAAESEALRLAGLFWEHHEKMQVPLVSVKEAVAEHGGKYYPTIAGTGTEDYFCGSYNFENRATKQYQEFTTPYAGLPQVIRPDGVYLSQMRFGLYRWHITDPIRFEKDLAVTIQAIGWRDGWRYRPLQDDIASTAFWYQTEPHAPFPKLPDKDALEISEWPIPR